MVDWGFFAHDDRPSASDVNTEERLCRAAQ
jgi:hypothetical protein